MQQNIVSEKNVISKKVCTEMSLEKKVCTKILFPKRDIALDFIDSDIFRFFGDNMDILSVDLNDISLADINFDVNWCNRFKAKD